VRADLAANVLIEVAERGPVIVPDHHGEILAGIGLVEVDEGGLAFAAGRGMDAGDLAANRGGFSGVRIGIGRSDTLPAKYGCGKHEHRQQKDSVHRERSLADQAIVKGERFVCERKRKTIGSRAHDQVEVTENPVFRELLPAMIL